MAKHKTEMIWPSKIEIDGKMQNVVGMIFLPKNYKFHSNPIEIVESACKGFLGYKK